MKIINLRDLYPDTYVKDEFILIDDEIAEEIKKDKRREENHRIKVLRHRAYYSIDYKDAVENTLADDTSIGDMIVEKEAKKELYIAMSKLTKKQQQRIYAHYFMGLTIADIAKTEKVSKKNIAKSISKALRRLQKYIEDIN